MEEKIYQMAHALLDGEERSEESLRCLCRSAIAQLEGRLADGVSPVEIEALFVTAAALLTVSLHAQLVFSQGSTTLRAGNISVSRGQKNDSQQYALSLRQQAELLLGDYLREQDFAFRGVPG